MKSRGLILIVVIALVIPIVFAMVFEWVDRLDGRTAPGLPTVVGPLLILAIAYAGGCFGRWLYRREHGREPTTADRQQKSPPPGGEGFMNALCVPSNYH